MVPCALSKVNEVNVNTATYYFISLRKCSWSCEPLFPKNIVCVQTLFFFLKVSQTPRLNILQQEWIINLLWIPVDFFLENIEENWRFNSLRFFLVQGQYKTMIMWGAPFSFLKKTHKFGLKSMKNDAINAYLLKKNWKRIYKIKKGGGIWGILIERENFR